MDNFTHSLTGWALGQTGLKRTTRKGLAALILGANMPDIDVFFGWVPWAPLATHRGFTHGLVGGVLILPPVLALLLWLLDKWQQSRAVTFKSGLPMKPGWLVLLCYTGAITHPLLDLQTTYAIQLLSPFSTRWFHAETLFIVDVWIWTGMAFAIWLSRRRERRRQAWRAPAIAALAVMCAYIALNGAITLRARDALRTSDPHPTPEVLFANEEPVFFWKRNLVWRERGMIGRASYDPVADLNRVEVEQSVPDNMADPDVQRAARQTSEIRRFMGWSVLPMAHVERLRCSATVTFTDARFGLPRPGGRFVRQVVVPSVAAGC